MNPVKPFEFFEDTKQLHFAPSKGVKAIQIERMKIPQNFYFLIFISSIILLLISSSFLRNIDFIYLQECQVRHHELKSDRFTRLGEFDREALLQLWKPEIFSECNDMMPETYAPCKQRKFPEKIEYAEEVVYPGFQLKLPRFFNENQRDLWIKLFLNGRNSSDIFHEPSRSWVTFPPSTGQNFVLRNIHGAKIDPKNVCMSGSFSLDKYLQFANSNHSFFGNDELNLLLLNTPDSWSFQHFIDHGMHSLIQLRQVVGKLERSGHEVRVHSSVSNNKIVNVLRGVYGIKFQDHQGPISARRLIIGCKCPRDAPYLDLMFQKILGIRTSEPKSRKYILYFSRKQSKTRLNAGRIAINEDEFLDELKVLLKQRNKQEKLLVYDDSEAGSVQNMLNFFRKNVIAVIGVHGGALYNHRFMGPSTLIVEIVPTSHFFPIFWKDSAIFDQNYWAFLENPIKNSVSDVKIPIANVLKVLKEQLGVRMPPGSRIKIQD